MNRFAANLLVVCFLALGTGALQFVHELGHLLEDREENAAALAAAVANHAVPPAHEHHDEDNCQICAQLHLTYISGGWTPVLVCLGLFVAFLSLLDTPLIPRLLPLRLDCRGPPIS